MNRKDFLTTLAHELRKIEPSELQDVLQYYNEYFDDAGVENEQSVLEELGSPQKLAQAIKESSTMKYIQSDNTSVKRSFKALWITIWSICAAPIALPIAAVIGILLFCILLVYGILIFSLYLIIFVFAVVGTVLSLVSFFLIPSSFPTFMFALGCGLMLIGLGTLIYFPVQAVSKSSAKGIILFINKHVIRRGKA